MEELEILQFDFLLLHMWRTLVLTHPLLSMECISIAVFSPFMKTEISGVFLKIVFRYQKDVEALCFGWPLLL